MWPSSRKAFPKQFSPLLGPESLYQKTLRRLSGELFGAVTVLTHADFRFLARQQAEEIGLTDARIVLEPASRNTAPAILTAALMRDSARDDLLLIAPSDHLMNDPEAFSQAIVSGIAAAESGQLVTFGVTPDRAETGFGYLELYDAAVSGNSTRLRRFVEKPDSARAAEMVASGRHLWNSGIFLFRVADILAAFEAHAAELIAPCCAALTDASEDLGFLRLEPASYGKAASVSIDYAVMEKADNISVVPVNAGWSDVGSWKTLYSAQEQTENGVATDGPATALDCENTYLRSEEDSLQLVGLGLKNIVAVATRDAVLVADIDRAQDVRTVVERLRADGVAQADTYPRFHRPWGWYETLCLSDRFQVKRIMVHPGGILSLQSHVHRSEHWVVVAGTAQVTVDGAEKLFAENQSVYIPIGAVHRLENPGKVAMYLIEVQTGPYLGEDDITRYEDVYDRS